MLQAAVEVFSEVGYEAATVRQLCERAGAKNIAAVNYYFGGKEKLYAEAVGMALRFVLYAAREANRRPTCPPKIA